MTTNTQRLQQNIIHNFGEKGKLWLSNLPNIINILSNKWQLSKIYPVDNMNYNYVAKALTHENKAVALKIGCNKKAILDEKWVLEDFKGRGIINIIDWDEKYQALLLQQAIPGTTLKTLYHSQKEFVIDCYVNLITKLHGKPLKSSHNYSHASFWLEAIDKLTKEQVPDNLLKKAIYLKDKLLKSSTSQRLLHGDLHHDNILKDGNKWLSIDPQGIIGEIEFELAAFDFIHKTELDAQLDIKKLFFDRAKLIAQKANINLERFKDWVFVRIILSAAWTIEASGDPSLAIKLAKSMF